MSGMGTGNAASTGDLKRRKYVTLESPLIAPLKVKTWGPSAKSLYKEISKRLFDTTHDLVVHILPGKLALSHSA